MLAGKYGYRSPTAGRAKPAKQTKRTSTKFESIAQPVELLFIEALLANQTAGSCYAGTGIGHTKKRCLRRRIGVGIDKQHPATGKGKLIIRGDSEIVEDKKGFKIIISSIPYQVNKSDLITKIADLVKNKIIEDMKN